MAIPQLVSQRRQVPGAWFQVPAHPSLLNICCPTMPGAARLLVLAAVVGAALSYPGGSPGCHARPHHRGARQGVVLALAVEDQFLLGDEVLVAPVMEEGAISRDIYLPRGRWRAEGGEVREGPAWLRSYPAPSSHFPTLSASSAGALVTVVLTSGLQSGSGQPSVSRACLLSLAPLNQLL